MEFSNFGDFVKKWQNRYVKLQKMRKFKKLISSPFNHISNTIWVTEAYNTSFWSSWPIVLTSSLNFGSRSHRFLVTKQNARPDKNVQPLCISGFHFHFCLKLGHIREVAKVLHQNRSIRVSRKHPSLMMRRGDEKTPFITFCTKYKIFGFKG